ncbi:hypothetical protein EMCRGX_G001804 [Ephydatia muelleri]
MVSVQWTIVTYFLYIEMVIVFLLCLPISAHGLKSVMESFVIIELRKVGKLVFYSFIAVLIILFGDAVRVTFLSKESAAGTLDNELSTSKDLYKAERNCFISGFSLFLSNAGDQSTC